MKVEFISFFISTSDRIIFLKTTNYCGTQKSLIEEHARLDFPGFLSTLTSHSAYAATETELYAAKIDGLLPPNFL